MRKRHATTTPPHRTILVPQCTEKTKLRERTHTYPRWEGRPFVATLTLTATNEKKQKKTREA